MNQQSIQNEPLTEIPVLDCGPDFALESLRAYRHKTEALLEVASRRYPERMPKTLDRISRAWLARWDNRHLDEIDCIADELGCPGAYFFSVNYEWGCTCQVMPSGDGQSAQLVRVLDWLTPGLGENLVCLRVSGTPAGLFVLLTWPGYSGVLQVMAPDRFSIALNQAPMRKAVGLFYLDWVANRRRVWNMPHPTPAYLLREVCETAGNFTEAKRRLTEEPISSPAIFTLAGTKPNETAVIERQETEATVRSGRQVATNHWEIPLWVGHARGIDSAGRSRLMRTLQPDFDPTFSWLKPPILNDRTRLAMVADAAKMRLVAQGFEAEAPATAPLELSLAAQQISLAPNRHEHQSAQPTVLHRGHVKATSPVPPSHDAGARRGG